MATVENPCPTRFAMRRALRIPSRDSRPARCHHHHGQLPAPRRLPERQPVNNRHQRRKQKSALDSLTRLNASMCCARLPQRANENSSERDKWPTKQCCTVCVLFAQVTLSCVMHQAAQTNFVCNSLPSLGIFRRVRASVREPHLRTSIRFLAVRTPPITRLSCTTTRFAQPDYLPATVHCTSTRGESQLELVTGVGQVV